MLANLVPQLGSRPLMMLKLQFRMPLFHSQANRALKGIWHTRELLLTYFQLKVRLFLF